MWRWDREFVPTRRCGPRSVIRGPYLVFIPAERSPRHDPPTTAYGKHVELNLNLDVAPGRLILSCAEVASLRYFIHSGQTCTKQDLTAANICLATHAARPRGSG